MKTRRLSALVALLALSRLFSSGAATYQLSAASQGEHDLGAQVSAAASTHHHGGGSSTRDGDGSECANVQHDKCLAMSACATALPAMTWSPAPAMPNGPVLIALAAGRFEPARAPDPPPPRL